MIGHELSGRYEIVEQVGGGGMALVYKAHDVLLNRHVAIKVLRQQFVHDEEFIRRFRREAQSAASLSHPNVVSIYDVGQEDETHYIVMEYVEGSNLNEIILERAPLQAQEAVHIALQICDALEHAHHNQIIHRDIKPHNILIGKNNRVKVTDFGIARAVTSSTITQTGSVVGSVHYFSPEHAKGVNTGEKSDLYSLGIVLYQMLTGRLPFLGESPISVALKHLQENFEEPRRVNPHIPQSLENIILRSMRKDPAERYSSAEEMIEDLDSCLLPERMHEAKLEFADDAEATRAMPAIRPGMETVAASPASMHTQTMHTRHSGQPLDSRQPVEPQQPEKPAKKKWVKPVVTIGVTLLVLALLLVGFFYFVNRLDTEEVDVPNVINEPIERAVQILEENGLKVEDPILEEVTSEVEPGIVLKQNKQNMRVKVGSYIQLVVSIGPEMQVMQSYIGDPYEDARAQLIALGVAQERIEKVDVYSEEETGSIVSQSLAAGEQFNPEEASFSFEVSQGLEPFDMPELIGKSQNEAINILRQNGLVLGPGEGIMEKSSYRPAGEVLEQFPFNPGDKVTAGDEVTITVSSGLPEDALEYTFNIPISPAEVNGTPRDPDRIL
ncbi:Stk1 family PASTA domain-containing Ser/Thr kinase [Paenibacillus sp. 1P07SE]